MSNKTRTAKKSSTSAKAVPASVSLPDPVSEESSDKISRIRDLILGPHLRDISQQFANLSKDIGRIEGDLSRVTDELRSAVKKINQEISDAEKRVTTQLNEVKSSTEDGIAQLDQRTSTQLGDLDQQFKTRILEIVQDVRDLENNSRQELRQTVDEMNQVKMDRFSLGELFSQLGDGLKASKPEDEVASLLNALEEEIK